MGYSARFCFWILLLAGSALLMPTAAVAQRDREARDAPRREGGLERGEVVENRSGDQQGTEEGAPQLRGQPRGEFRGDPRLEPQILPPQPSRWRLGIFAYNTDTGVVVTRVVSGSPAARIGLERGDRIVTVGGYQVGWINDRLYPLPAELEAQAGPGGRVLLLIQNVRGGGLLNRVVNLEPAHNRPRDRFPAGPARPGLRAQQADES